MVDILFGSCSSVGQSDVHNFQLYAAVLLDCVWMARNRLVHVSLRISLHALLQQLQIVTESISKPGKPSHQL